MVWSNATVLSKLKPLNTFVCNKIKNSLQCFKVPANIINRQLHVSAIISSGPTRARRLKQEELRPIKNKVDEDGNPYPCALCKIKIDYKNVRLLSQFISNDTGMIYGRRVTEAISSIPDAYCQIINNIRLCGHKQKQVTKAIRRARTMGFMPYTYKKPEYLSDPKPF